jgi:iron complex outermembrane receptor protein
MPGIPERQAYAQLRYRQPKYFALVEALGRSDVAVNDANDEFAPAYYVINLAAGLTQQGSGWRLSEYVRVDNVRDRSYAGSVIVNEGNRRFYEPAPTRNYMVGVQGSFQF